MRGKIYWLKKGHRDGEIGNDNLVFENTCTETFVPDDEYSGLRGVLTESRLQIARRTYKLRMTIIGIELFPL